MPRPIECFALTLSVLDLPPLPNAESDERPLVAVFAAPWLGAHTAHLGASDALHQHIAHDADDDRHGYLRSIRRECIRIDEYVQGLLQATRLFVGASSSANGPGS